MSFELPKLKYAHDALEPHIDEKTMTIHHGKHHQGYTNKLNAAIEGTDLEGKTIENILTNLEMSNTAVRNNGGGFFNHRLFWEVMSPNGGGAPSGDLAKAINDSFGSFSDFKEKFTSTTAVIQGSGWGWLVYNPSSSKVEYKSMPNQTSPRTEGLVPLLGCDVWEHAYYLNYQNKRPVYIEAWWNVVNWDEVESRFSKAK